LPCAKPLSREISREYLLLSRIILAVLLVPIVSNFCNRGLSVLDTKLINWTSDKPEIYLVMQSRYIAIYVES
jgi:hypothetical protein